MITLEIIKKALNKRGTSFSFREALGVIENLVSIKTSVTELENSTSAAVDDLVTLSGVPQNSEDLGTFSGTTITDNETVKGALQELETAHETTDTLADNLVTLSGVAANSVNLGIFQTASQFPATVISNNLTTKAALQALDNAATCGAAGVFGYATSDSSSTDGEALSVLTTVTDLQSLGAETRTLGLALNNLIRIKIIRLSFHTGDITLALTNIIGAPTGTNAVFGVVGQYMMLMSLPTGQWAYISGNVPIV